MTSRDDWSALVAAMNEDEEDDAVRMRTRAAGHDLLRRRRRARGVLQALCGVALFAAGFGAHALVATEGEEAKNDATIPAVEATHDPAPPESPLDLEIQAELAAGASQSTWYRKAGDAWLAEGDTLSATRCYREHLVRSPPSTSPSGKDATWLLVALQQTFD